MPADAHATDAQVVASPAPAATPVRSSLRVAAILVAAILAPGLASLLGRAYARAFLLGLSLHLTPQLLAFEASGMRVGLYAMLAAYTAFALIDYTLCLVGARDGAHARARSVILRASFVALVIVPTQLALLALNAWHLAPIGPFQVPSPSMAPALKTGDFFMVGKQRWPARALERGDIVVFTQRMGSQQLVAVKRVVALAGERVDACGQPVRVDGVALKEPYLHHRARPQQAPRTFCRTFRE